MESQEEIDELADAIYRDKVLRARRQSFGEKFLDGLRLFEQELEETRAKVAAELDTDDHERIAREVQRRFELKRKEEERGLYHPVPTRR